MLTLLKYNGKIPKLINIIESDETTEDEKLKAIEKLKKGYAHRSYDLEQYDFFIRSKHSIGKGNLAHRLIQNGATAKTLRALFPDQASFVQMKKRNNNFASN